MNNEIAFFLIMLLSLIAVLFAGTQNKNWLYAMVVLLSVISSITAGKLITVFGLTTSVATPIYAGIFLATDAISEMYGKKDARNAVLLGFFSNVFLVGIGQLIINTPATLNIELSDALSTIFNFIPRLVLAGLFAFIIAQTIDIQIFHFFKSKKDTGKHSGKLWFRNNVSTIVSQFIDSIIVYSIAFYGMVNLQEMIYLILTAWFIKVLVAVFDTPFLYLIRKMKKDV